MIVVYFLLLYYPIHELVLKLSGLDGAALFFLRQFPDLVLILFFGLTALQGGMNVIWRNGFARSVLAPASVFVLYATMLSFMSLGSELAVDLSEIFVLVRYVLLFGLVCALRPRRRARNLTLRLIVVAASVQVGLGLIQIVGGEQVINIFRPVDYVSVFSEVERIFTSNSGQERRMLIGSVGDFISFGYIVAILIFITLASSLNIDSRLVVAILLLAVLYFGGSRMIFLGTFVLTMGYFARAYSMQRRTILILALSFFFLIAVEFFLQSGVGAEYDYDDFAALFSPLFIQSLLNQRLGIIVYLLPEVLASPRVIFGFSPDRFYFADYVWAEFLSVPTNLVLVLPGILEDVYIAALLVYYGVVGLAIIVLVYARVCRVCLFNLRRGAEDLAILGLLLLIAGVFFSFANQVYENRVFSFYFWLVMGLNAVAANDSDEHAERARDS